MSEGTPHMRSAGHAHWIWPTLATVVISLAMIFIGLFARDHWDELKRVPAGMDPAALVVYTVSMAAYFLYQGFVWRLMYRSHGYDLEVRRALTLYLSAILLAYVPGKVAAAMGIAALARTSRVPVSVSVYLFVRSQLMFLFVGIAAAVTISLSLPPDRLIPLPVRVAVLFLLLALIGSALLWRGGLGKVLAWSLRFARVDAGIISVSRGNWARDLILLYASWFVYSVAFWWLVRACAPTVDPGAFAFVAVVLIISYLGAFAAVFVPAGLGVLETELILGLGQVLEPGTAVWVAIGHRLLSVAVTVVLLALLALARARLSRPTT